MINGVFALKPWRGLRVLAREARDPLGFIIDTHI
jgi:hypothetical protein